MIMLSNFTTIGISKLMPGHTILATTSNGSVVTDVVATVSISRPEERGHEYQVLTTDAGMSVTMTGEHHLPVGESCCMNLAKAKDVQVGETVWVALPTAKAAVAQKVTQKHVATEGLQGLYSPVLVNGGFPIVDGIVTSFDSLGAVTLASYGLPLLERVCKATRSCGLLHRFMHHM